MAMQWGLAGLIFASLLFFIIRQWNSLPDFDWRFRPLWLALAALGVFGSTWPRESSGGSSSMPWARSTCAPGRLVPSGASPCWPATCPLTR